MIYKVKVTQIDEFYKEFKVEANSEEEAEQIIQNKINNDPIEYDKSTFMGSDTTVDATPLKTK